MHDQRRTSYAETLDFVPTPPWATRAFIDVWREPLDGLTVMEPCVGRGDLARVLEDSGARMVAQDIKDYGYPGTVVADYTAPFGRTDLGVDWTITNPPFALAEQFFDRAYRDSRRGVVFHIRTGWLNGVGRWDRIFSRGLLTGIVMHAKNVSATQGATIRSGSNQFNHSWLVFDKRNVGRSIDFRFIPADAQARFERDGDYY